MLMSRQERVESAKEFAYRQNVICEKQVSHEHLMTIRLMLRLTRIKTGISVVVSRNVELIVTNNIDGVMY
jgi:hypothetical protein